MRVLMFAYYFPPYLSAGSSRSGQLAKYLARAGADVVVVTAHPHDLPLKSDIDPGNVSVVYGRNLEINAIPARILRRDLRERGYGMSKAGLIGLLGSAYKQLLNFPDPQVGWIPGALAAAGRLAPPDVVLSSSPPPSAHIAAMLYARRHDVPWVAEFRDPWIDNLDFTRWWPARTFERRLHDRIIPRANAIVAVSRSFGDAYGRILDREVHHISNGYDPDDFAGDAPDVHPGELSHAGTIYAAYDTELLLRGVRFARRDVRVLFSGRNLGDLAERVDTVGVRDRVRLLGPVLRSEAVGQMRRSEANIVFFVRRVKPLASSFVPQKLYEYLGAGRPVLAVGDGEREAGDILRSSGLGVFVDTPQAVARAIDGDLRSGSPDRAAIERFSYPVIATDYLRLLRAVVR